MSGPSTSDERNVNAPSLVVGGYVATVTLSAFLLFLVEPMVGKMLLPLAGGAAAVWTTSLVFFQGMLLAGYAYSHFAATRLRPRRQAAAQVALMVLALLSLPIGFAGAGAPAPGANPAPWLLMALLVRVGPAFFVISTLSPLLQSWFARAGHARSQDPYFLYGAGNAGSLAGLLAYPLVLERFSGLTLQSRAWQAGYVILAALVSLAAVRLWRSPAPPRDHAGESAPRLPWQKPATWIALAAVPSLWLVAVTTLFTTRIRPIPLLWVIPLAIYLLTFAVVFGRRSVPTHRLLPAYPFVAIAVLGLVLLAGDSTPFLVAAVLHFGGLAVAALLCHGRLAAERPHAAHLTAFYLAISAGGALGGLLGAIVAPVLLPDIYEYPLAVIAAAVLLPASRRGGLRQAVAFVAVLAAVGAPLAFTGVHERLASLRLTANGTAADLVREVLILIVPALAAVGFSRRPRALAIVLAGAFGLSFLPLATQLPPLYQGRDFFGLHTVLADPAADSHVYENAGVIHGIQSQDPRWRDQPAAYYSPSGPLGDVFARPLGGQASIAVVGLGTGATACYARPGQAWTFYELDPAAVRIARDPGLFTYLRDCTPQAAIVLGDARQQLAQAPNGAYDLIVVDAFSGDAPPVHLLTLEALRLYESKLRPGGLLAFHISNSYVNFSPVLSSTGAAAGLAVYTRIDLEVTPLERTQGKIPSQWVLAARRPADAAPVAGRPGWQRLTFRDPSLVWTDDYSNLLSVLRLT